MATATANTAAASIKITVTDEGAGTSTTYNDPHDTTQDTIYDKPNSNEGDRLSPSGQMYVAKGAQSTKGMIISVREKHGSFRTAVPCMPFPMAVICCLLNIFTPGLGTFISSFTVFCCGYTGTTPCRSFLWNILAALLQAITFIFIVGWIWSISWGMTFITLSDEYRHEKLRRKQSYKSAVGSPT